MASAAPEIPVLARDQAFETLYRRYVKDVYHYALALLRNPADAEDVTQTTFMNAYRAYKRGDEILKPHNWLIKIAHNVARTRYARASRRVKEVPLEDHVEQLAVPEDERPNVEGVLRALGRLPFNQRAALIMRELEGRSYAEISDTLGVSVPAVETLIFRARRSLRVRVSALRVLGAVPLPSSLTQLFEGGGLVAGGSGALVGSGLVVKATIALVAGAVATGIGGDRSGPTTAAPQERQAVAVPWTDQSFAQPTLRGVAFDSTQVAARGRQLPAAIGPSSGGAANLDAATTKTGGESRASPGASSAASLATPAAEVPAPVSNVVDTVEQTASDLTSSLPVELPGSPPLPAVDLPAPPALPPLP